MPGRPMPANRRARASERSQSVPDGWRSSIPEMVVTCLLVLATCAGVYGYAGTGAAVLALGVWSVIILVLLRLVLPVSPEPEMAPMERWQHTVRSTFLGFWRKRGALADGIANLASYDAELRATLQHLLAARLAERHGISLYADPEAARRLLLRSEREQQLWFWLDPRRPAETRQGNRGIPAPTLAAIIDRLERL